MNTLALTYEKRRARCSADIHSNNRKKQPSARPTDPVPRRKRAPRAPTRPTSPAVSLGELVSAAAARQRRAAQSRRARGEAARRFYFFFPEGCKTLGAVQKTSGGFDGPRHVYGIATTPKRCDGPMLVSYRPLAHNPIVAAYSQTYHATKRRQAASTRQPSRETLWPPGSFISHVETQ